MDIDFPYHLNDRGRTAVTNEEDHIRDLIEQVLFTAPGERVNRPTFGSGMLRLVFEPNSDLLTTSTQALVQGALQQWLGDRIVAEAVQITNQDTTLRVAVQYTIRRTQQRLVAQFTRST
jgi:uncharacterized protein